MQPQVKLKYVQSRVREGELVKGTSMLIEGVRMRNFPQPVTLYISTNAMSACVTHWLPCCHVPVINETKNDCSDVI